MSTWFIQVTEETETQDDAHEIMNALRIQDGFVGGRIIAPSHINPPWRIQAFFESNGESPHGWLPDGMRHVMVPNSRRGFLFDRRWQ